MRRKPQTQGTGGYNNQNRKPRYQGSGGGDSRPQGGHAHHNNNGGRPRRNYSAMREKYLAQARDALASGDRVLAENYFQHADHCYRMMVEEGYNTRNNYTPPPPQNGEAQGETTHHDETQQAAAEEAHVETTPVLPAFLTAAYESTEAAQKAEPVIVQNWEE